MLEWALDDAGMAGVSIRVSSKGPALQRQQEL